MFEVDETNPRNQEILKKRIGCGNFVYQCDERGEIAIWYCKLLGKDPEKDHEGNCGEYSCPLGYKL